MLGHAMRCLFLKRDGCHAVGSCSTSFIAEHFGVHQRAVKDARQLLCHAAWLIPVEADGFHVRRYGGRWMVNHGLRPPSAADSRMGVAGHITGSAPPIARRDTKSAPSVQTGNLPSGARNQKRAERRSNGVRIENCRAGEPDFRGVVLRDLEDGLRTEELFRQACRLGLVNAGECGRLRFFGAAEHAKRIGSLNHCGLFVSLVRRGLWHFISQADEDAARRRLNGLAYSEEQRNRPCGAEPEPVDSGARCPSRLLSADAEIAKLIRGVASQSDPRMMVGRLNGPNCICWATRTRSTERRGPGQRAWTRRAARTERVGTGGHASRQRYGALKTA